MTRKLAALLSFVGIAAIGGVLFNIARPDPGVSRAALVDAGITEQCEPVRALARVRDLCQNTLADGGLSRRYRTIRDIAYRCPGLRPGDPEVLIPRWLTRPALRGCFDLVGQEALTLIDSSFDDGGASVEAATDECTCRATGKLCRITDGGTLTFNRTYDALAGPFVGAGCEPTPCSELDGEQGQAIAEACR